MQFPPVDWMVITEENLEEQMQKIKDETGSFVVFGINAKGYENLAIGIGDLRRYINEQKSIIVYYENAIKE